MIVYVLLMVVASPVMLVSMGFAISGAASLQPRRWQIALLIFILSAAVYIYSNYHYLSPSTEYVTPY